MPIFTKEYDYFLIDLVYEAQELELDLLARHARSLSSASWSWIDDTSSRKILWNFSRAYYFLGEEGGAVAGWNLNALVALILPELLHLHIARAFLTPPSRGIHKRIRAAYVLDYACRKTNIIVVSKPDGRHVCHSWFSCLAPSPGVGESHRTPHFFETCPFLERDILVPWCFCIFLLKGSWKWIPRKYNSFVFIVTKSSTKNRAN